MSDVFRWKCPPAVNIVEERQMSSVRTKQMSQDSASLMVLHRTALLGEWHHITNECRKVGMRTAMQLLKFFLSSEPRCVLISAAVAV